MYSLLSDERLVKAILGGDKNAFSKLYERYHGPVYSAAYRILRDPEEAQDATQEIFFKLYRSLHSWDREKSKLSTWIYRVASNHSIDCCRMHSRRAELRLQENGAEEIGYGCRIRSLNLSPHLMVQFREQLDTIQRFIDKLPDLQKRTFIRRYFQGLKLVEIAEIETEYTHFGRSLIPLINGKIKTHRDAVFAEGGYNAREPQCFEPVIKDPDAFGWVFILIKQISLKIISLV